MSLAARIERRTGATPLGQAVAGLSLAGLVLGRAVASRGVLLLVYGGFVLLAGAWALGRRRLSVEASRSSFSQRLREGQAVDVELSLTARRRVTTVVVVEHLPDALGGPVRVPVPVLPAGEQATHAYRLKAGRRGVYEVGPLDAEWTDPFGLTRHRLRLAEPTPLIVHPGTELVTDRVVSREWEDPPLRPPVSKPWPTGFEFHGMRDYAPGDDPRRIVWRAVARSGEDRYLVREAEQGITDRVHLFVDTDGSGHSPGPVSETFEAAVRVAASLGVRHLEDGFSVSLDANAGRLVAGVRSRAGRIPLLDALAALGPGREPLHQAVGRLLLLEPRRTAHNVLVTPHLDGQTASRLRLLLERGTSLLVVLVQWEGSDFASAHRAGALGCPVVEVSAGVPLDRVFQRAVRAGSR